MDKPEKVLFDIGNVILRATHQITFAILWELGVRPDKVALFFHQKAYGEFALGRITGEQFAQATREVLEAPWLTDKQIRAAHDAHIYMVDDAVMEVIRELDHKKRLLGFVTTTNEWQTEREHQFLDLGSVVRSHEIGMTKTSVNAWIMILQQFKMSMDQAPSILLVDDASANNAFAETVGLATYQYDPRPIIGVEKLIAELRERQLLV
ncbi:MAG: hypothetical protein Q7S16_00115 [bacterium]|nr:hypothetical protein [bacterium]